MLRRSLVESIALTAAVAGTAGTTVGLTMMARGDTRGAPGVTRALSRLGKTTGGGMVEGLALAAGTGAVVGLVLYRGVHALGR